MITITVSSPSIEVTNALAHEIKWALDRLVRSKSENKIVVKASVTEGELLGSGYVARGRDGVLDKVGDYGVTIFTVCEP